jgi:hypothetical protein
MMLDPLRETNATRGAIAQATAVLRNALGSLMRHVVRDPEPPIAPAPVTGGPGAPKGF